MHRQVEIPEAQLTDKRDTGIPARRFTMLDPQDEVAQESRIGSTAGRRLRPDGLLHHERAVDQAAGVAGDADLDRSHAASAGLGVAFGERVRLALPTHELGDPSAAAYCGGPVRATADRAPPLHSSPRAAMANDSAAA
jgi:hypothetical protein